MRSFWLAGTLLLTGLWVSAHAQSAPVAPDRLPSPTFQAATIKPSTPNESLSIQIQGRRFATTGTTVVDLLKYAYGLHADQIVGGPIWLATEKFDVLADPDSETRPASDQFKKMVQQLIAQRFSLTLHRAQRVLPAYTITVAKGGAKLTVSKRDPGGIPSVAYNPSAKLMAGNATMTDFAAFLQRFVTDRPVVDRTGITGTYDLALAWSPELQSAAAPIPSGNTEDANSKPGLFTSIQEQLGLELEAVKAPIDVLVVDHIEQPSAN